MDKTILQVPSTIVRDKSLLNGSRQFTVETQENISPDLLHRLISMEHQLGWFSFALREIKPEDIIDLPALDETQFDMKKSSCKWLRDILFRYFESKGGKKEDFNIWYVREMQRIGNSYKNRIEE